MRRCRDAKREGDAGQTTAGAMGCIVLAIAALAAASSRGDEARPAFEAVVVGSKTFAYSGPGDGYYPTQLLKAGEKVTVLSLREDGWATIVPPAGSFSWIPGDELEEQADGTGRIRAAECRPRIGSLLSEAHHVYQVTLPKGASVQIVDQAPVRDNGRIVTWFKVLPHADEARYVAINQLRLPEGAAKRPAPIAAPVAPLMAPVGGAASAPARSAPLSRMLPPSMPQASAIGLPIGTRVIPPAQPLTRSSKPIDRTIEANANEPPLTFRDDPNAPWEKRLQALQAHVDLMRTRAPETWDLPAAQRLAEDLRRQATTDPQRQVILELQTMLRRLEETQTRFLRASRRVESTLARDRELAEQLLRKQQAAAQIQRTFTAEGILRRASIRIDDTDAYTLENLGGTATHYVVPVPGLAVERYLGQRVGLLGLAEKRAGTPIPVIRAEQLTPLAAAASVP